MPLRCCCAIVATTGTTSTACPSRSTGESCSHKQHLLPAHADQLVGDTGIKRGRQKPPSSGPCPHCSSPPFVFVCLAPQPSSLSLCTRRVPTGSWYCEGCERVLQDRGGGVTYPTSGGGWQRWSSPEAEDEFGAESMRNVHAPDGPAGLGAAYRIGASRTLGFESAHHRQEMHPLGPSRSEAGLITSFMRGNATTVDEMHMDAVSSMPRPTPDEQRPITSFMARPSPGAQRESGGKEGWNRHRHEQPEQHQPNGGAEVGTTAGTSPESAVASSALAPRQHNRPLPEFVKCPRCDQMVNR